MSVSVEEFTKAIKSLEEALQSLAQAKDETMKKLVRDACIQRFEFSVELAWKTSRKVLGSSSTGPKIVVREMAQNGLIQDTDLWFDFLEARNKSSHTYNEDIAREVLATLTKFPSHANDLLARLKAR